MVNYNETFIYSNVAKKKYGHSIVELFMHFWDI